LDAGRNDSLQRVNLQHRRVNLSQPRFNARFKAEVSIPPAAQQLLGVHGSTVTQVAMELNFCSSQHFATVFRRYTGHSPRTPRLQSSQ
jgi:AraC-like DNA-binding protein